MELIKEIYKSEKKLSAYIDEDPTNNYLISFKHGLGDLLMFYPALEALRLKYPKARIDLVTHRGQESLFDTYDSTVDYRCIFSLQYPLNDSFPNYTKTAFCCKVELGIDPKDVKDDCVRELPNYDSPFIALGLCSNCRPHEYGIPRDRAMFIYNVCNELGYIPIDLHFKTESDNPVNRPFPDIKCSTRDAKTSINNLFGVLHRSYAFIGGISGPLYSAIGCLGKDRVMLVEPRRGEWKRVLSDPCKVVYVNDLNKDMLSDWLTSLRGK